MPRFLIWAIVLLPAGAIIGYHFGHRQYRSVGLLHINPVMEKILYTNEANAQIPMFDEYMYVEAQRLSSRRVLEMAMDELDDLTKRLADVSAEVGQSSEVVTRLKSSIEKCQAEWLQISRDKMRLDDLKDEKSRAVAALHQTQDRIDSLQVESSGSDSRLDIVSDGDSPSPVADISDTHIALAGVGGGAGLAAAATLALTFGWRRRTA